MGVEIPFALPDSVFSKGARWGPGIGTTFNTDIVVFPSPDSTHRPIVFGFAAAITGGIATAPAGAVASVSFSVGGIVFGPFFSGLNPFRPFQPFSAELLYLGVGGDSISVRCNTTILPAAGDFFVASILVWGKDDIIPTL